MSIKSAAAQHAEQNERLRHIGVILPATSSDPEFQTWLGAFLQALAQSDWVIGRNIKVGIRWATPVVAEIRRHAAELAPLAPDVILTGGTSTAGPMLEATRSAPIVFATENTRNPRSIQLKPHSALAPFMIAIINSAAFLTPNFRMIRAR